MFDPGREQAAVPHAEGEAAPEPSAPNIVTLPDGHVVTLHPKITLALGAAAMTIARATMREAFAAGGDPTGVLQAVVEAGLAEIYVRFGVQSWTFVEDGVPVPVTADNIKRLLPFEGGGKEVAEAADSLYSDTVFGPLVAAMSRLLPTMPTENSTPPIPISGSMPRRHSKRSSPKGSAGGKRSAVRAR